MTYATSGFVDHYTLDALRRAVDPKLNPAPNEMSPAVTKYRVDLEQYWNKHCLGFSISLRDYLTMSAYGEAQYAPKYGNWYIVGLPHGDHEKAYAWCVDYGMSEWKKLASLFNHDWHGVTNIGGKRWFDIANHAADWQAHFDNKQLAKWIDHAADLEHNSKGGLFNKDVPFAVLNRDLSKADINNFLDWKLYCKNIPLQVASSQWSGYVRQPVRMFVERYMMLWHGQTQKAQWLHPVEYYLATAPVVSPIKWGDKVLKLAKTNHGKYATETNVKTETKKYVEKAVSNGVTLDPYQYGGIPAHLLPVVGALWMYAIANDGKEVETDGS